VLPLIRLVLCWRHQPLQLVAAMHLSSTDMEDASMNQRARVLLVLWAIVATMLSSPRPVAAQDNALTIQIDEAAIHDDPRLRQLVSLSTRSMPLLAVLDAISEQTGVEISMDDLDVASGYALFASYSKVPAGTVLNALYGLFSINRAEWAWTRQGRAGGYRYRFHETPWAKNRSDTYNRILDGLLKNYVSVLRKLAPMTMADRKLHRNELSKALLLDDDSKLNYFFASESLWNNAKFFFGILSLGQQDSVLAGESVSISLHDLPQQVYDLYHVYYTTHAPSVTLPGSAPVQIPEPQSLRVYRSLPGGESGLVAPEIVIESSSGGMSWMGSGWLQFGVREALKRAWVLSGDSMADPASKRLLAEVKDTIEIRRDKQKADANSGRLATQTGLSDESRRVLAESIASGLGLGSRLEQLSAGSTTPVLAVLRPGEQDIFASPVGKPVQEFLDRLEDKNLKRWYYKWRSGVLLVSNPSWFMNSTPAIPFRLLKAIRPDAEGQVPLSGWTKLMRNISDSQAGWFASTYGITGMSRFRPCLLIMASEPDVTRPDGVSVDSNAMRLLQAASLMPRRTMSADSGVRVRIATLSKGPPTHAVTALQIELFDPGNNEWTRSGIVEIPIYRGSVRSTIQSQ